MIRAPRSLDGALRGHGAVLGARGGDWVTARVPIDQLAAIRALSGVRGIELARRATLNADSSIRDVRADVVRTQYAPTLDQFRGSTGRGALVGIVDTGIDFRHEDFVEDDVGRPRVLFLWDQTLTGPGPGRVGDARFSYGLECTREQLASRTSCPSRDIEGHGTHVAGTAAGDGSAAHKAGTERFVYTGIAPGAELIVVKSRFTSTSVVDGVAYVFARAKELGRPAVVNLSLGFAISTHDGDDAVSLMLDALTGPGRIIVTAAGNSGNNRNAAPEGVNPSQHGAVQVAVGASGTIGFAIGPYAPQPGTENDLVLAQAFYAPADEFTVTVTKPDGGTVTAPFSPSGTVRSDLGAGLVVYNGPANGDAGLGPDLELGSLWPSSRLRVVALYIGEFDSRSPPPQIGVWTLRFDRTAGSGNGVVDAYLPLSTLAANIQFTTGASNRALVDTPGSARNVITVGGYSTRAGWRSVDGFLYIVPAEDSVATGDLLLFSSPGPTLDGRTKPEISAPGRVFSALSTDLRLIGGEIALISPDSAHVLFEGTSMAAPHVTGAVALLLAERPTLTPDEVRQLLIATARQDAFTARNYTTGGAPGTPNAAWGHGKLDVAAAVGAVSPLAGRGIAALNPTSSQAHSSRRGTAIPIASLRVGAMDAESLSVTTVAAVVDGRDADFRLEAILDLDRDREVDDDEPIAAATAAIRLEGPTSVQLAIQPGVLGISRGGTTDILLAGRLSGTTPNGTLFSVEPQLDKSTTTGARTGVVVTLTGLTLGRGVLVTTLLSAEERFNLSQNPVRFAPLIINFAEQARSVVIFDFAGRPIRRFVPLATERSVSWDLLSDGGSEVAAGAYIVYFDLPSGSIRRKIFVVRDRS
jgi:subtilisin family serine protease